MNETRTASPADDEDWEIVPLWDPLLRPGPTLVLTTMLLLWFHFAVSWRNVQSQILSGGGVYGLLYRNTDPTEGYEEALAATSGWLGALTILFLLWLDRPRRIHSLAADLETVPGGSWIRARMVFPPHAFSRFLVVAACCGVFSLVLSGRYGENGGQYFYFFVVLPALTTIYAVSRGAVAGCIDRRLALATTLSALVLLTMPLLMCSLYPIVILFWGIELAIVFGWWWDAVPYP